MLLRSISPFPCIDVRFGSTRDMHAAGRLISRSLCKERSYGRWPEHSTGARLDTRRPVVVLAGKFSELRSESGAVPLCRATFEAGDKSRWSIRPLVGARSTAAGGHQESPAWLGD